MSSAAVCMARTRAQKKLREHFGETDSFHLPDRPLQTRVESRKVDSPSTAAGP